MTTRTADIETQKPSAASLEAVARLVGFPTISTDSNLALIHWVRGLLDDLGIASHLTHSDDGRKANLFATIHPGDGRVAPDKGGIVLSGHTDVVGVDPSQWSTDPFTATLRGTRLYGRGTADMKGFLGVVLALLPAIAATPRAEPVHLALSYDEEVGCKGVPRLIEDLARRGVTPAVCLVGEPSSMRVITGHKGSRVFRCLVTGKEAHSSLATQGVNAVHVACRLVEFIRLEGLALAASESPDPGYAVPFSTIGTGAIAGGTAVNVIPGQCEFRFQIRHLPDTDPEAVIARIRAFAEDVLLAEMQGVDPTCTIAFTDLGGVPALNEPPDSAWTRRVARAAGNDRPGIVDFGSEGGHFQRAGISTVICGPGDIAHAHRPDEFIDLDQLAACERFLTRLLGLTPPEA
ncbi:acetylornithine deacetylase [Pararhodobacter sp.]|uniref:acetylornithine deacetylase n=1 Tax=Pararhodobacter sp. TaxID=2127056 RepID=UPI002FDF5AFA|nr:acetylornithine deacetylase [Pseudomonadota bacterium]